MTIGEAQRQYQAALEYQRTMEADGRYSEGEELEEEVQWALRGLTILWLEDAAVYD